jgi:hypothetical protein
VARIFQYYQGRLVPLDDGVAPVDVPQGNISQPAQRTLRNRVVATVLLSSIAALEAAPAAVDTPVGSVSTPQRRAIKRQEPITGASGAALHDESSQPPNALLWGNRPYRRRPEQWLTQAPPDIQAAVSTDPLVGGLYPIPGRRKPPQQWLTQAPPDVAVAPTGEPIVGMVSLARSPLARSLFVVKQNLHYPPTRDEVGVLTDPLTGSLSVPIAKARRSQPLQLTPPPEITVQVVDVPTSLYPNTVRRRVSTALRFQQLHYPQLTAPDTFEESSVLGSVSIPQRARRIPKPIPLFSPDVQAAPDLVKDYLASAVSVPKPKARRKPVFLTWIDATAAHFGSTTPVVTGVELFGSLRLDAKRVHKYNIPSDARSRASQDGSAQKISSAKKRPAQDGGSRLGGEGQQQLEDNATE